MRRNWRKFPTELSSKAWTVNLYPKKKTTDGVTDAADIASRGLMIRHLVMPNRVAGTEKFVRWVAESLPKSTYLNIMPQYRVEYKAYDYPEISRGIRPDEFLEAMEWAEEYGLTNLDPRSLSVRNFYRQRRSD